jgi:hypothetical protein
MKKGGEVGRRWSSPLVTNGFGRFVVHLYASYDLLPGKLVKDSKSGRNIRQMLNVLRISATS